jgi:hypothetical protein
VDYRLHPHLSPFGEYEGAYVPGGMAANGESISDEGANEEWLHRGHGQEEKRVGGSMTGARDTDASRVPDMFFFKFVFYIFYDRNFM